MEQPVVSVVIPTWNRAGVVCEAVESALSQRENGLEIIVVDDGSTDNTSGLLLSRFGPRIRLLQLPRRLGIGAARNAGVSVATGQLLAFLDSDDVWLPGKLDAELEVLKRYPNAEAIVSDSQVFIEGQPNPTTWFGANGLLQATGAQIGWLKEFPWVWGHWKNTVAMCSITLRRSALDRIGEPMFPEDLINGEDWELEMRVYNGCHVVVLPEVWSHVRRIFDDARPGRGFPGKPFTQEQKLNLLRDKLKILERTLKLSNLRPDVAQELESCRTVTAEELAECERAEA